MGNLKENVKFVILVVSFIITIIFQTANTSAEFSNVKTRLEATEKNVDQKIDRELIEAELKYIRKSLDELKQDVKELKRNE